MRVFLRSYTAAQTGVPQGAVSSPFLFTVYTNDFRSSQTDTLVRTFSDDTIILKGEDLPLSTFYYVINIPFDM